MVNLTRVALAFLLVTALIPLQTIAKRPKRQGIIEFSDTPPGKGYGVLEFRIANSEGQASNYVDKSHIRELYEKLLTSDGPLKDNIRRTFNTKCDDLEKCDRNELAYASRPSDENTVLYRYFRNGWMSASAEYHSFLTIGISGSAVDTSPFLELSFSVSAQAEDMSDSKSPMIIRVKLRGMRPFDPDIDQALPAPGSPESRVRRN